MIISNRKSCCVIFFILICTSFSIFAQTPISKEYQIKAAFLLNFTRFIEWPSSSFASDQAPIIIGVLGNNPFGNYLNEIVADEKIGSHPLIVQQYKSINDFKSCHILFVNKLETEYLAQVAGISKGRDILTVSDAPNFLRQGGMILFFTKNNKIQFQVNLDAVKTTKLDISSKLLRLAEIFVP